MASTRNGRFGPRRRLAPRRAVARNSRLANNKGRKEVAQENTEEVPGAAITNAIAVFLPILRALMIEAEASGKSGPEKQEAVAEGAEAAYRALQQSVKELRFVPWAIVGPLLVPAADSMLSVLVGVFNKLWGKVWAFVNRLID